MTEIFPDYGTRMRQVREAMKLSIRGVVRAGGPSRAVIAATEEGHILGEHSREALDNVYRACLENLPAGELTRWALTGEDCPEAIRRLLEGR